MNVRELLKKSSTIRGMVNDCRAISKIKMSHLKSKSIINAYLSSNKIKKFQLGSGTNYLPGWLNNDITPGSPKVVHIDAKKRFPIEGATFDYIYNEHMIEHLAWHEGLFMLKECRKILKKGGILRISTPDLGVLINLYSNNNSELGEKYIKCIIDKWIVDNKSYKASIVINNAFRAWGHQFLYDSELLEMSMKMAGFDNIVKCSYGESSDINLKGIECHGKSSGDEDIVLFETLVMEGK